MPEGEWMKNMGKKIAWPPTAVVVSICLGALTLFLGGMTVSEKVNFDGYEKTIEDDSRRIGLLELTYASDISVIKKDVSRLTELYIDLSSRISVK